MRIRRGLALAAALLVVAIFSGVRCDRRASEVEARRGTAPSRFIDVDGLRVHYRDRGAGPVVVLLHGSNASLLTWERWVAKLASDHRVVTLDLPGHGLTGPDARARYSATEMAGVVDQFTRALGIGRFIVGGNSMGGGVAWHYALLHPERVERLILVDSAGYPSDEPPPLPFRLYANPVTGHLVRWITPHFLVTKSVREVYGDPTRVTPALVELYEDVLLRDGNREATRRRFSSWRDDKMWSRLGDAPRPDADPVGRPRPLDPAEYGDRFHHDIPGSQLVRFDQLGHVPMEEDPDTTVAAVQAFLATPAPH